MRIAAARPSTAQANPSSLLPQDITERMKALRLAGERCDLEDVLRRAREVRTLAPRASDAWIEACAHEMLALHDFWVPSELERAGFDLESALAARRLAEPGVVRSAVGPLHPAIAQFVIQAEIDFARVFQARGDHVSALSRLRFVLDDLPVGPCDNADQLQSRALLAAGRSLERSGRAHDARAALESLRDDVRFGQPGEREGKLACALLESSPLGFEAYRGKYVGDASHRARMLAVRELVPAARARLARAAAIEESDIPAVVLGVADATSDADGMVALTVYDPRTPDFAPVIVFHSEALALDLVDVEQVLVHELVHAWLLVRAGIAHESLPGWLVEGLAEGLAGQTDVNLDNYVSNVMLPRPEHMLSGNFWKQHEVEFEAAPCELNARAGVGLVICQVLDHGGVDALRKLAHALRAGQSADEALESVTGLKASAFLAAARLRLAERVEERRVQSITTIHHLLRAEEQSPGAVLRAADEALAVTLTRVARGFALWKRSNALESLKRFDEAQRAYEALHAERLEQPGYVELARKGRAKCLLARGEIGAAKSELESLRRDAFSRQAAVWCNDRLGELAARAAQQEASPTKPR